MQNQGNFSLCEKSILSKLILHLIGYRCDISVSVWTANISLLQRRRVGPFIHFVNWSGWGETDECPIKIQSPSLHLRQWTLLCHPWGNNATEGSHSITQTLIRTITDRRGRRSLQYLIPFRLNSARKPTESRRGCPSFAEQTVGCPWAWVLKQNLHVISIVGRKPLRIP